MAVKPVDLAVIVYRNKQPQLLGLEHRHTAFGHRARGGLDLIDDQQNARLGQQLITGERGKGHSHQSVQGFGRAASMTARIISIWVPQRQRLADSSFRICSSLGWGLRSSNALAVMIMPFMQ